jgi:uncharacterized protein
MSGTIINVVAILIGSAIGLVIGHRLNARMQESIMTGMGLTTFVIGVSNAQRSGNIVIPLLSLVIGIIIGELLGIDDAFKRFAGWLQTKAQGTSTADNAEGVANERVRFINGFVTASLVFGIGPLAILGPIQNGVNSADVQALIVKSILDFFGAIAFAASLGIGVAFAALPVGLLQGTFALAGIALASTFSASGGLSATNPYIRELVGSGGLLLMGLALILLGIKQPRIANYLPALLIAPLLVGLATLLHINIYPL